MEVFGIADGCGWWCGAGAALGWPMALMWLLCAGVLLASARAGAGAAAFLAALAFGGLLANLPGDRAWSVPLAGVIEGGLGPVLLFFAIGLTTDLGVLLANPLGFLVGGAAQLGVFLGLALGVALGFPAVTAAGAAMAGGGEFGGALYLSGALSPDMAGAIGLGAGLFVAFLPACQGALVRALTSERERRIPMRVGCVVARWEKLAFAFLATTICALAAPGAAGLVGMLMLGSFVRESGLLGRFSVETERRLVDLALALLGLGAGLALAWDRFLRWETALVALCGAAALCVAVIAGIWMAKLINLIARAQVMNPLVGAAAMAPFPFASRALAPAAGEDPGLMAHLTGANLAGLLAGALVAGHFLGCLG